MRKVIGVVVLVVGLVALGVWGWADHAQRMQASVAAGAQGLGAGAIHGVSAAVSGRDIELTGIADSAAERDALLAAANAVPGRRVVRDALQVLPQVQPFTLEAEKPEGGTITATGHVPLEATRAALGKLAGDGVAGLTLAAGAPEGWGDLAGQGLAALSGMIAGKMTLSDLTLTLSGKVATPDDLAKLAAMVPAGSDLSGVSMLDDGTPAKWRMEYAAASGGTLSGKLPKAVTAQALAESLGLATLPGTVQQALIGADQPIPAFVTKLAAWLPMVETLTLEAGPEGETVTAGFGPGADLELLQAGMAEDLGPGVRLAAATVAASGTDGAQRENFATGETETFSAGYWLPVADFTVSAGECAAMADEVLADAQVNFVTGSARLDGRALRVLNRLGGVMLPCAKAGLAVEIGGHTDNVGDPGANMALSQARAEAVRAALIARGLPQDRLAAKGFGADQPVAPNDTDEGRAKNRRTSIIWSE